MLAKIKIHGGVMEQEQLKQFTFYELYADILSGLNDLEAGKFAKRFANMSSGTSSLPIQ